MVLSVEMGKLSQEKIVQIVLKMPETADLPVEMGKSIKVKVVKPVLKMFLHVL